MDLIDSHCHLDVAEFDRDRDTVLDKCRRRGVNRIVVPGIEAAGWPRLLALCAGHDGLFPALGMHPLYLHRHRDTHLADLESSLGDAAVVAVGEIGLDYYVRELDRDAQQTLFEAQLAVAREAGLPVILHVRKAHDQAIRTLRRIRMRGGIVHAFNGSLQQGLQLVDMGFKLGFGGMMTYERSRRIRGLAHDLPASAIVLETDAPDMTVASHHGERNSPEYLPDCLQALARIRDEPPEDIARVVTRNTCDVLGLERVH